MVECEFKVGKYFKRQVIQSVPFSDSLNVEIIVLVLLKFHATFYPIKVYWFLCYPFNVKLVIDNGGLHWGWWQRYVGHTLFGDTFLVTFIFNFPTSVTNIDVARMRSKAPLSKVTVTCGDESPYLVMIMWYDPIWGHKIIKICVNIW